MPTSRLPLDIKDFLTEHIDSVGQLEILFLLLDRQGSEWTVQKLSNELRSNQTVINNHLSHLIAHKLITKTDNGYVYDLQGEEDERVRKLHASYKEMPVSVIAFLYEKPKDKLKSFADAFKFKKD